MNLVHRFLIDGYATFPRFFLSLQEPFSLSAKFTTLVLGKPSGTIRATKNKEILFPHGTFQIFQDNSLMPLLSSFFFFSKAVFLVSSMGLSQDFCFCCPPGCPPMDIFPRLASLIKILSFHSALVRLQLKVNAIFQI